MTFKRHKRADEELTAEFSGVIERLEGERPDVTALEMDEIKVRAMRRAARSRSGYVPGLKGVGMRRSAATFLVIASLMAGGTGAALAGGDGNQGDNHDSGKSQYGCPPGTHGSHCKPASQSQQQPPPPTHQSNRGSHGSHAPPPPQSHGHGNHGGWEH